MARYHRLTLMEREELSRMLAAGASLRAAAQAMQRAPSTLYLRRCHRFRRPYKVLLSSRPVQDIVSIDERPAEVADRTVPGHWEGDLLVGHANASALGTLVERTIRFMLLVPLQAKDASAVRRAFAREVRTLPVQPHRSLTYDQGREMREHRLFTKTGCCANSFPPAAASIMCRGARSNACRPCSTIGRGRF